MAVLCDPCSPISVIPCRTLLDKVRQVVHCAGMAKEMFSARIDSDLRASLTVEAAADQRSVSNMLELILRERYAALTERVGSGQNGAALGSPLPIATGPDDRASRSVSAAVPGRAHDVPMRPHFRGDRPALQCDELVPGGGTCSVCGKVVV